MWHFSWQSLLPSNAEVLPHSQEMWDFSPTGTLLFLEWLHTVIHVLVSLYEDFSWSPCTLPCLVKLLFTEKLFPHLLHENGFSPVWILWCSRRWLFRLKEFPHSLHVNGFSSVWILWCLTRSLTCLKDFLHSLHENGFSPVWILWCARSRLLSRKHFPHTSHVNGFSPVWTFRCCIRWCL